MCYPLMCCMRNVFAGANIARDIGEEQLSEATIGYRTPEGGHIFQKLFATSYFYCSLTPDVVGTEMCGTLKNIVALACGMVQGLGYGPNTEVCTWQCWMVWLHAGTKECAHTHCKHLEASTATLTLLWLTCLDFWLW